MLGDSRRGSGGFCRARVALREHGKKRSEIGVGGRKRLSAAGTGINGGDGGRYTSDEPPRRKREVVNPHQWPVRTKIAQKSKEAKGSPPTTAFSRRGTSQPKPTPGVGEERIRSTQTRMRKIPPLSTGVRLLDSLRSCSVAGSGKRDRKSAFPLVLLRYSRVLSSAVKNSSHCWTRALWSPTLQMLSSAL